MKHNLLGTQELDFIDKNGNRVKGTNLFVSYFDDNILGEGTDKLFMRDDFPLPPVKVGDELDVEYNRKGKVVNITKI